MQQATNTALQLMQNPPDIIIIRGAPGSGKSQTSKSLSKYYPKGVRVEVDNLRNMVISPDWKNQSEHINVLNLSTKVVTEFLNLNFKPIILVDTFSGDKLQKYLTDLKMLNPNVSISVFGLYVTEEELEKRIGARGAEEFRDVNICKRLNSDVLKFKNENEFLVSTTGRLSEETAKIIYNKINNFQ